MGRETRRFQSEERKSRDDVVAFFRHLSEKLQEGKVALRQGQDEVVLQLPEDLVLEIQVEDKEKKRGLRHSLEIEITWYDTPVAGGPVELD